ATAADKRQMAPAHTQLGHTPAFCGDPTLLPLFSLQASTELPPLPKTPLERAATCAPDPVPVFALALPRRCSKGSHCAWAGASGEALPAAATECRRRAPRSWRRPKKREKMM